jgi:ribosomal silencing factor RsfS
VFLNTAREFYDLERLWQDATVLDTAEFLEGEQQ